MPFPGIQLLERGLRHVTAPLAELVNPTHDTVRRTTHEPVRISVASPIPEDLHRAAARAGSLLQAEQVELAIDLLQGWHKRGADGLFDLQERAARFPTAAAFRWAVGVDGPAESIELQPYGPISNRPPAEFQPEAPALRLTRDKPFPLPYEQITGELLWTGGNNPVCERSLRRRWCSVEAAARELTGNALPETLRAPRAGAGHERAREVLIGNSTTLHFREFRGNESTVEVPGELFRGEIESKSIGTLFETMSIRPLAGNTALSSGIHRFLTTLAEPERSTLSAAHTAVKEQRGLERIEFSTIQGFGWETVVPPSGEAALRFRSHGALHEVRLGAASGGRYPITISVISENSSNRLPFEFREVSYICLARTLRPMREALHRVDPY